MRGVARGDRAAERRARAPRPLARAVGVRAGRRCCCRRSGSCGGAGGCGDDIDRGLRTALRIRSRQARTRCSVSGRCACADRLLVLLVCRVRRVGRRALRADRDRRVRRRRLRSRSITTWRTSFATTLRETFDYDPERIVVLAEREGPGVQKATRENVQRALGDLRKRLTKDDQLLVLLIGHGTVARRRRSQVQPRRARSDRRRMGATC